MALVGLSLVLASVVWPLGLLLRLPRPPPQIDQPSPRDEDHAPRGAGQEKEGGEDVKSPVTITTTSADDETATPPGSSAGATTRKAVNPTPAPPTVEEPSSSQTTPKAAPSQRTPNGSVPSFSLSPTPSSNSSAPKLVAPPASAAAVARSNAASMPPPAPPTFSAPVIPDPSFSSPATSASSMMPPPPRPPTLNNLNPAATSRAANLSAPNSFARSARQPGTSTLAPPPTHSSKPAKPSRKVMLEPGHSPLDWARLAQSPTSDLRNLPAGTPT
ncbi:hypothetical protein PG997_010104 [Apiospora hydei]|uniref:Uncharacterized protein n=1 Tax=Apiospora hydei TaxID=1337664 RepID=A0ABR1VYM4_9PEZI